jgi:PKD domain
MRAAIAVGVAFATLAFAQAASAAVLCVNKPSCANNFSSLSLALSNADSPTFPDRDTIEIGAGTLAPEDASADADNAVDIVGAGVGATTLQGAATLNGHAVELLEPTSTISDLSIKPGSAAGTDALRLAGTADRIAVIPPTSGTATVGVRLLAGSTLRDATISLGTDNTEGIETDAGGSGSTFTVQNVRIAARIGMFVDVDGMSAYNVLAEVDGTNPLGIVVDGTNGNVTMDLRHAMVVISSNADGATGMEALGGNGNTGRLDVFDSVVTGAAGTGNTVHLAASKIDNDLNTGAALVGDYMNYDETKVPIPDGVSVTNFIDGAPAFVNAAARDFRPRFDSIVVDSGTHAFPGAGAPPTDLGGGIPITDGDGNGFFWQDLGPYEYQRRAPNAVATASPSQRRIGQAFRFGSAGSSDPDGDPIVSRAWNFGDGTTGTGASPAHAYRTTGLKTVRLTITDASGRTDTATRTVRVLPALPPPDVAPVFRSASMVHRSFLVGTDATTFLFNITEAARVRFTIQRRTVGRRVRGKCVKRTRRNRRRRKCVRYVRRGAFTRQAVAGQNAEPWSGRLRGRALAPGRYRAVLRATDATGNHSRVRRLHFRIRRRG